MKKNYTLLISLAILIYCLINSFELFYSWVNNPVEKYSFPTFVIWCSPLIYASRKNLEQKSSIIFLFLAMLFPLLGNITSLNFLKYIGLVFALSSFLPFSASLIFWMITSVCWMPLYGWIGLHYFPGFITPFRYLITIVGTAVHWFSLTRKETIIE